MRMTRPLFIGSLTLAPVVAIALLAAQPQEPAPESPSARALTAATSPARTFPTVSPSPSRSPAPRAIRSTEFHSMRHRFLVRHPVEWVVRPAASADMSDVIESPEGYRFQVRRYQGHGGVNDRAWIDTRVPARSDRSGWCGPRAGELLGRWNNEYGRPWEPVEIDGMPAVVRSECGYVDGVAKVGADMYLVSLVTPSAARWLFERLVATIRFDAAREVESLPAEDRPSISIAPAPQPLPFASTVHGYTLSYPSDWTPAPATADGGSDIFEAPSPSGTRLSITRRSKPASMPLDIYAEKTMPHHAKPTGCHWDSGVIYLPAGQQRFERTASIAARETVIRAECGVVDAVINLEDEVLVVVLRSGTRMAGGDLHNFQRFAETLRIDPPPSSATRPTDLTKTFTSPQYGYSIRHPAKWIATAAKQDGQADKFEDVRGSHLHISMLDRPAGMTAVAWANRSVPDRADTPTKHRHCEFRSGGYMAIEVPPQADFDEDRIDDRDAAIRSLCGYVDAVVALKDHLVVIMLQTPRRAADGDDELFWRFTETLRLPSD
jgi:hypothetical protein